MTMKIVPLALSVAALAVATPALCQVERGPVLQTVLPMNTTVHERVTPQVEALLEQLIIHGRDLNLDGTDVFSASDKFLPGKIAIGMAHAIEATEADDPKRQIYLDGFRRLSELTIDDTNDTWGTYYYISALYRLQRMDLMDQAVSPEILARLRTQLDWRIFVDEERMVLIDLPNNYFGVAFSVARLRYLLGWESEAGSEKLLAKTLDHYRQYSGEYGFADETDGEGRFDRYSVLLIGEIAQRFIETDVEPPAEVRQWLRQSVDLLMPRLNLRGEGFEYGRSIGVYGETAFVEVLSAAAALDLLTPQEEDLAYAFSSRVAARYADYWVDSGTGSVNMWDHGRKTDAYRGKHRILGENLSLSHQLFYTNDLWNSRPVSRQSLSDGIAAYVAAQPRSTTTWFYRSEYDRLLVTYRDGERLISLPIINGHEGQHMHTPYFPIPFSPGILVGSPDETYPQLLPQVTLNDGSVLMPLAYFKGVEVQEDGDRTIVTWHQDQSDRMGEDVPQPDARIRFETRYTFSPGSVSRRDRIVPADGVDIASIDMVFASFSERPVIEGDTTRYAAGEVASLSVNGLSCETARPDTAIHAAPTGAFSSLIECRAEAVSGTFETGWNLSFR